MYLTVMEAAREACLRLDELLQAIEAEELETIEAPDGQTLIDGDDLAEFVIKRRSLNEDEDEEDEEDD